MFVIFQITKGDERGYDYAWLLVTVIYILPFMLLAPINGAISNTLPKRWVLVGSAAFCLAVLFAFGQIGGYWLWCFGLVAAGSAVYSPTRYAILPAVAHDLRMPLN